MRLIICLQILLVFLLSLSSSIPIMTTDDTPMLLASVGFVVNPNLCLSCLSYSETHIKFCLCWSVM